MLVNLAAESRVGKRRRSSSTCRANVALSLATLSVLASRAAVAAQYQWIGTAGNTAWTNIANWSPSTVPTSSDDAVFDQNTYLSAPSILTTDAATAKGLIFGDSSGLNNSAGITIGGTGTLTLGSDGIYVFAGSGPNMISAPITFAAPASVSNFSANNLSIGSIAAGSSAVTFAGSGITLITGSSGINTSGGVIVSGTGTVHFSLSNSLLSGGLTINGGVASFDSGNFGGNPFATGQTITVNSGGELLINAAHALGGSNLSVPNNVVINGGTLVSLDEQYISTLTLNGGTTLSGTGGDSSHELRAFAGGSTINSVGSTAASTVGTNLIVTYGGFTFNVGSGSVMGGIDLTDSGQIYGGSSGTAFGITKSGAGTLLLSNASSTFMGNVLVSGGTLTTNARSYSTNNSALGAINVSGRMITVNTGATLNFTTNNIFTGNDLLADIPTINLSGGTLTTNNYNIIGNLLLSNSATLTQSASSGGYSGFQLLGSIVQTDSSSTTISATNGGAISLGSNTDFNVSSGGTLTVSAPLQDQSPDFGGAAGSLTKDGPGTLILSTSQTYTGTTTVNGGTLELTIPGNGSGLTTTSGITINNGGTFQVTQDNGLYGQSSKVPVIINAGGTLTEGSGNSSHISGLLTLAGGTLASSGNTETTYGSWDLDGGVTVTANSTISAPNVEPSQTNGTIFNVASGSVLSVTGTFIKPSTATDTGVVLIGGGGLTLSGSNSYVGATNVSAGVFTVNGSTGASSAVTVGSAGILAGSGKVNGSVTVNGTISGGTGDTASNTPGNLSTGSATWGSTGTYVAKVSTIGSTIGANVNDKLIMSGLSISSGFAVKLLATNSSTTTFASNNTSLTTTPQPGSYVIIADETQSNGGTNPFASLIGQILTATGLTTYGTTDTIKLESFSDGSSGYDLAAEDVSASPEPTAFLLLGSVISPLLLSRRRRLLNSSGDTTAPSRSMLVGSGAADVSFRTMS